MTSKDPYLYRKLLILTIDLSAVCWMIYEMFFSPVGTDFFGLFLLLFIGALIIYNLYAIGLSAFLFTKGRIRLYFEALFVLLLGLPILVLWYFTSFSYQ